MWKCRLSAALTAFLLCAMPICGAFATDVNASVPQVEVGETVEGNASTTVEIFQVQSYTYPADTPILTVTVLDEKEAPFPNVQVKLYERPQAGATGVNTLEVTGSSREAHLTDENGKRTFHLLGWETQEYSIQIDHTGYEPVIEGYFSLKEKADIERTIRLKRKASAPIDGGNGGGGSGGGSGGGGGGNDTEVVQPDPAPVTDPAPATEPETPVEPEVPAQPEGAADPDTSDEPGTQDDAPDGLGLTPSDGGAGGGNGGSGGGGGGGGDIADPTGGNAPDSTPTGTGNAFSAATQNFQIKTDNIAGSHFATEHNCIIHVQVVVCCGLTLIGGLLWRAHLRAHYRHLRDYHRKRINRRDDDDDLDDDNSDDDNMLGGGDDIPLYGGGRFGRQPQPGFAFRVQNK